MVAPAAALARIPDGLTAAEAGPLMCAGITTFNSLRHAGARSGDLVAVLGIGGLGHLGVQFAARMGYETVAIARGRDKEALARQLGAHHYVDSSAQDPAKELQIRAGIDEATKGQRGSCEDPAARRGESAAHAKKPQGGCGGGGAATGGRS